MSEPRGMLPSWTAEDERRHQWLLTHIRTCTACAWRNEDDSSQLCAAAEQHFAEQWRWHGGDS